jgi:hypothetical protein
LPPPEIFTAEQIIAEYPGDLQVSSPWFDPLSSSEKLIREKARKSKNFQFTAPGIIEEYISL